jgi:DNA-binding IclR family transcriptional regulator
MSRPALAATRAVAVLGFLTAHPTESFTLSDLASRLDINLASAHAVLTVLADSGFVTRHPRLRTFTLGPSVVALGTAALECHPVIDMARDAARDLARGTGLEVAVTAPAGDRIVFLARAGEPSAEELSVLVGQHVPLVPPIGSVFVAWGGAKEWLARAEDPDALETVLEAVRHRGYSVGLEARARKGLGLALHDLAGHPADDALRGTVSGYVADLASGRYQLAELVPSRSYDVSFIAAPIFGSDGQVVLALTLLGFTDRLRGRAVAMYGERLRDTGLVVTKRSRGRVPTGDRVEPWPSREPL